MLNLYKIFQNPYFLADYYERDRPTCNKGGNNFNLTDAELWFHFKLPHTTVKHVRMTNIWRIEDQFALQFKLNTF